MKNLVLALGLAAVAGGAALHYGPQLVAADSKVTINGTMTIGAFKDQFEKYQIGLGLKNNTTSIINEMALEIKFDDGDDGTAIFRNVYPGEMGHASVFFQYADVQSHPEMEVRDVSACEIDHHYISNCKDVLRGVSHVTVR